jgi:hypothetical protein
MDPRSLAGQEGSLGMPALARLTGPNDGGNGRERLPVGGKSGRTGTMATSGMQIQTRCLVDRPHCS